MSTLFIAALKSKSGGMLAASLARSAFRADAAGPGANHFVATADRADDIHEHAAERFLHAFRVAAPVAPELSRARGIIRQIARDHVDQFFLAGARQIRHRTIKRFLFHLRYFFQRQLRLSPAGRGRFLVTFDELATEPAKHVIGYAGGGADVRILGKSARFKTLI